MIELVKTLEFLKCIHSLLNTMKGATDQDTNILKIAACAIELRIKVIEIALADFEETEAK